MIPTAHVDERQFWVEVVDGSGVRTGTLSNLRSASITRVLDGVGSISLAVSGTDKNASDLLVNDAKVRLYIYEREEKRLLGSGVVKQRRASDKSDSFSLIITGPDEFQDLRRKSVLLALEYNDEDIADIINGSMSVTGLLDFLNGWSATVDVSDNHYARFDGLTIFKALQALCEGKGIHFRLGDTAQTIEVGAFGAYNNLSLVQMPFYTREQDDNDTVAFIESITIDEDGDDTVDFIVPLGATTGSDVALTLAQCTRTTPYNILSDTFNGTTYYYIGNSIKTISQIRADNSLTIKVLVFDQIQIQSNSDADIETAANALYDVAVAYFLRHQEPLVQYDVVASKVRQNIKPGDKILMQYKGWIEDGQGNLLPPVNINNDFWVMDVTDNVNLDGVKTSLKLSNIDRHKMDAARVIVGELENARIRNLSVKPYTAVYSFVYPREVAPSYSARIPIRITDRVLRVRQVTLNIKSTPFRATSQGAAAGGDHSHVMFNYSGAGADIAANDIYVAGAAAFVNLAIGGTPPAQISTYGSSGTHTHDPVYGISDDTLYPGDITITINGVDRTVALGGDWGSSGSSVEIDLDITEYIVSEATLRQVHEIVIGCGSGQGRIEVSVEVYADIQNVKVS